MAKNGQQLFGENDWEQLNIPINWASNATELYLDGFYTSARNAVGDMLRGRGSRAVLVYPAVYNYRQYLELRLKTLLLLFETSNGTGNGRLMVGHDLAKIWSRLRPLILGQYPDYPIEELKTVEEIIEQFMSADPKGDAFRYPFDTSGSGSIDITWDSVSVGALHTKMHDIHWALGGLAYEMKDKLTKKLRSADESHI